MPCTEKHRKEEGYELTELTKFDTEGLNVTADLAHTTCHCGKDDCSGNGLTCDNIGDNNLLSTSKHFCCQMTTDGLAPDPKNCFGVSKEDKDEE